MHGAAFAHLGMDAVYLALPVRAEDFEAVARALLAVGCLGANVTVPHKAVARRACDWVHEDAAAIDAVNTLVFDAERGVCGYNTDAAGYVRALEEDLGEPVRGRRVLVLGGGGAARAVVRGLSDAGAACVKVVVRSPDRVGWCEAHPWTTETFLRLFPESDLLVDATSIGLSSASEAAAAARLPLELLPETAVVSSLIYHRYPALLAEASQRGLRALDGVGMLVHQGALALELWTGSVAPVDVMRQALLSSLKSG